MEELRDEASLLRETEPELREAEPVLPDTVEPRRVLSCELLRTVGESVRDEVPLLRETDASFRDDELLWETEPELRETEPVLPDTVEPRRVLSCELLRTVGESVRDEVPLLRETDLRDEELLWETEPELREEELCETEEAPPFEEPVFCVVAAPRPVDERLACE